MYSCGEGNFTQGKRIYTALCANCHQEDGSGLARLIPSLSTSKMLMQPDNEIICRIYLGVNADSLGTKEKYMPSFKKLTNVELTNLLNFLQERFAGGKYEYHLEEVKVGKSKCNS